MKNISKKLFEHIFLVLIVALIGILIGTLIGCFFGVFIAKNSSNYYSILIWLGIAYMIYFSQLILHEAGHYLFGKFSGYQFVSFRVGNDTWIRENGKLTLKKFKIPGTGGQCLMMPPQKDEKGDIYALYYMGGVFVNFVFSLSGALLYAMSENENMKIFGFLLCLIAGIATLINGIPLKVNGMGNDGYNFFLLKKDKIARHSSYIMLKANALQTLGVRIKEMPYEWFVLPEQADLSNTMNATLRIMEGNWFYDNMKFDEARVCYETLLNQSEYLMDIHKMELECAVLFIELIGQKREEVIHKLYTKKLINYIKKMASFDINKKKLQYVLCLYEKEDNEDREDQLEKIYNEAVKLTKTYPIKAEVKAEMEVFEFLRATKQIFAELEQNERQKE